MAFDMTRLEVAFSLVRDSVSRGQIPGAVVCVGQGNGAPEIRAFGYSQVIPATVPIAANTLFDLASLTKVICTTTLTLLLMEAGLLRLDDPVSAFVTWPTGEAAGIAIRHLLTHTSGLPAWAPLHRRAGCREAVLGELLATPLGHPPGTRVEYSCLGYILLGALLERLSGEHLDVMAKRMIFEPLGMADTCFTPDPARAAATELDPATGRCIRGTVHDENARAMGGVSGNAGLFGTAEGLVPFCQMMLGRGSHGPARFLSEASVRLSTHDHTSRLGETRGLGWVVKGADRWSSAGDLFSPTSFGHTGFTGTSMWIDPEADLFAVLLTNAIHPTRENRAQIRLRPLFHNAARASVVR